MLFLLMITSVYAAQPTEETNCCLLFDDEWTLPEECDQYEINKERCDVIIAEYESFYNWINYGSVYVFYAIQLAIFAFVAWLIWKCIRHFRKKSKKK